MAKKKVKTELPGTEVREKELGTVSVSKGFTKNMGDFNSTRYEVTITVPINPTKEELAEAKSTVKIVTELVDEELENILADL